MWLVVIILSNLRRWSMTLIKLLYRIVSRGFKKKLFSSTWQEEIKFLKNVESKKNVTWSALRYVCSTMQSLWIQFLFRFITQRLPYYHAQRKHIAIYKQTHKWVLVIEDLWWQSTEIFKAHFLFFQPHISDPNSGVLTK